MNKTETASGSQSCTYCSILTKDMISQQSADQLPWFHINPVEFDGVKNQVELFYLESEQEETQ